MIIGITGHKRAGKDTVGDILMKNVLGRKASFAEPMKKIAQIIYGWTPEFIEEHKDEVDPTYGISPRQFLQTLGTEFAQKLLCSFYPEYAKITGRCIWAKRLLREVQPHESVFITDVRFPHEVVEIKKKFPDAKIIRVNRPGFEGDSHSSETEMAEIKPDIILENDGTIEDLECKVKYTLATFPLEMFPKLYISGPMEGKPNYNIPLFNAMERMITEEGYEGKRFLPVNPAKLTPPNTPGWKREDYLRQDIKILTETCSALVALSGWEASEGAKLEVSVAQALKMPIFGGGKWN